jgi:hypothetical protein
MVRAASKWCVRRGLHHNGANAELPRTIQYLHNEEDFMVKLTAFQRTIAHLLM